jgi:hypothetical protein
MRNQPHISKRNRPPTIPPTIPPTSPPESPVLAEEDVVAGAAEEVLVAIAALDVGPAGVYVNLNALGVVP